MCQSRVKIVPVTPLFSVLPEYNNSPVTFDMKKYREKINNEKKFASKSCEIYLQDHLPAFNAPEE